MPFTTKRKAQQLRAIAHANQAKRQKLNEGGAFEQEQVRAGLMEGNRAGRCVEKPCTILPLLRESDFTSNPPYHQPYPTQDAPPSPLRIIFAPHSSCPASPQTDGQSRIGKKPTDCTPVVPFVRAQDASTLERVMCKQEPEDGTGIEPDSPPAGGAYIDPTPPLQEDATNALRKINKLVRPPRNTGRGYKRCKLQPAMRARYELVAVCLRLFLRTSTSFIAASEEAAIGAGRGVWYSRQIRAWVRQFIAEGGLPDRTRPGLPSRSLLKHEDIASEIRLFLQKRGQFFVAGDIVQFLNDPEVKRRLFIPKSVTIRTAQRWLHDMEYRWRNEQPGQYFDGHERADVVEYRQGVYVPKLKALEPLTSSWDEETGLERLPDMTVANLVGVTRRHGQCWLRKAKVYQ